MRNAFLSTNKTFDESRPDQSLGNNKLFKKKKRTITVRFENVIFYFLSIYFVGEQRYTIHQNRIQLSSMTSKFLLVFDFLLLQFFESCKKAECKSTILILFLNGIVRSFTFPNVIRDAPRAFSHAFQFRIQARSRPVRRPVMSDYKLNCH